MLHVWKAPLARATKDLDFLGHLDNSLENLEGVIRQVCAADVEPDGMVFDAATVKTERIKEDADYEGVRVRFVGLLGRARVAMQIDVGFSDVVTPGAENYHVPGAAGVPGPELSGYPRETVVAEKFPERPRTGLLPTQSPTSEIQESHREPYTASAWRITSYELGLAVRSSPPDAMPARGLRSRCTIMDSALAAPSHAIQVPNCTVPITRYFGLRIASSSR